MHRQSEAECGLERDNATAAGLPFLPTPPRPTGGGRPWTGGGCTTLDAIARGFSRILSARVVNQSGLGGVWGFALSYPDSVAQTGARDPNVGAMLPSAVEDQLGLRMQRQRGAVPILVISSVERPSEN
jgi:uncharacterized protein (TIGR03435 family)